MKYVLSAFIVFLFTCTIFFAPVYAAKTTKKTSSKPAAKSVVKSKKPAVKKTSSKASSTKGSGYSVKYSGYAHAYLRPDNAALVATFANLKKIKNVSYTLTYEANGQMEGVGGTVTSRQGNYVVRELFFGTCSSGVCRPHWGINNMKFEAVITYKTGKTQVKRFTFQP